MLHGQEITQANSHFFCLHTRLDYDESCASDVFASDGCVARRSGATAFRMGGLNMSDAPEPYDLDFETPAPVSRGVPGRAPGVPQPVPQRAPGLPQPAPAPAPATAVRAQRVTTFADRKPTCASCNQPIADTYYSAGKKIICPECHARIMGTGAGAATLRIFKAIAFGTVAGIVGAAIWLGSKTWHRQRIWLDRAAPGLSRGRGRAIGFGQSRRHWISDYRGSAYLSGGGWKLHARRL